MSLNTMLPWRDAKAKVVGNRALFVRCFQIAIFVSLFGFGNGAGNTHDGNLGRQLLWLSFGLLAVLHILRDRISLSKSSFNFGGWPVWIVVCYAFISTIWSSSPVITIKRATLLFIVLILTIACFGNKANTDHSFERIIGLPLLILIILSVLLTVIAPSVAISPIGWQGVASHKNELGQGACIALLTVLFAPRDYFIGGAKRWIAILLLLLALAFSKSSTSLISLVFGITITSAVAMGVYFVRRSDLHGYCVLAFMALILLLGCGFITGSIPDYERIYGYVLYGFGKSETLTGRTALWQLVLSQADFHDPMYGEGYGAFWIGPSSVSAYTAYKNGIYLGQAHNGYIDIYNDLGWIGLVSVIVVIVNLFINIAILIKRGNPHWKSMLALLSTILMANYAESTLFRTTQFLTIVLFAIIVFAQTLVSKPIEIASDRRKAMWSLI